MLDLHPFPAERQGFEPRVPRGTTVFKTAAIDHSATSPKLLSINFIFFDKKNYFSSNKYLKSILGNTQNQ